MATLTIRNVPENMRDALRVRAAKNGRSMEAELRLMIQAHLNGRGFSDATAPYEGEVVKPDIGLMPKREQPITLEETLALIDDDRDQF